MIRLAFILALVATGARAQPVPIRSGDHPDFARLVLTIPEGSAWDVGRIEGGIGIVLSEATDGFDTSGVFERIRQDRIGAIEAEGQLLRLRLLCDCHADAFLWRSDRLVVDIIDGPSPQGNPFEMPLALGDGVEMPSPAPTAVLPILIAREDRHQLLLEMLPPAFEQISADSRVDQAEVAVLSSLARAATEGFFQIPIEPVEGTIAASGDEEVVETGSPGLFPITDPMSGLGTVLEELGGPGILLRSGLTDTAISSAEQSGQLTDCLPDQALDIASWSDGSDFAGQISRRRSALTGEFDRYQSGAVEELARTYVHFGFGVEARRVLSLDGNQSIERVLLEEMARIVDGETVPSGRLADQGDCVGRVSLWHLLAQGQVSGAGSDVRGGAVREFRNLPQHLREHLGPRLAAMFVAAGDTERAKEVMEQLPVRADEVSVESALVRAEINEASGRVDATEGELATLAEETARLPPDAAAELLERQLDRGVLPPREQIELAQALHYESRPSGGNDRLAAAIVRSMMAADQFDEAEAALQETLPTGSDIHVQLFNELLSARVERLSDPEVLELALAELPAIVSPGVEISLADRLIRMGFPAEALHVLDRPSDPSGDPSLEVESTYLRASAHALLGDVVEVERTLQGRDDARAREIRAQVRAMKGDHLGALAETMSVAEPDRQSALAWRAGDWGTLEESDDDLLRTVARLAQDPTFLGPDMAELQARNALLEEASRTRQMTEDLLGRFSVEDLSSGNPE